MKHYRLFQAWQNQDKAYTDFITRIIHDVVEMEAKEGIDIEVIRYPAQDESGSPDVVDMVWEQIADSDIFVAANYSSCMQAYLLYQYGQFRDESKDTAISDGTFRYICNTQYLYAHRL